MPDSKSSGPVPPRDQINHPAHYNKGSIEVIDFIEDQHLGFHLGNAVKYICRCDLKGTPYSDLDKAIWYLQRYKELILNS